MSNENVTPIRPPKKPSAPRERRERHLRLRIGTDGEDGATLDIIHGLRGVCVALDTLVVSQGTHDENMVADLCQAAKLLAITLADRAD
jgi:hypothetical protein